MTRKNAFFSSLITLSLIVAFSSLVIASADDQATGAASVRVVQKTMLRPVPLDEERYKSSVNAYFADLPVLTNESVRTKFDEVFLLPCKPSADHFESLYDQLCSLGDPEQAAQIIEAFLRKQENSVPLLRSNELRARFYGQLAKPGVSLEDDPSN